ncbi:hypothetical protein MY4038_002991 [Beauveria bassiana]
MASELVDKPTSSTSNVEPPPISALTTGVREGGVSQGDDLCFTTRGQVGAAGPGTSTLARANASRS